MKDIFFFEKPVAKEVTCQGIVGVKDSNDSELIILIFSALQLCSICCLNNKTLNFPTSINRSFNKNTFSRVLIESI